MKRRGFIATASAVVAAGAAARARAQVIPEQPIQPQQQFLQQLTIAVNVTLSGTLQKYGQEVVKGVQAAVDEQNRFFAPVSHVWGMRALDDRNDPGIAASNANVAAADSSVIGIVGNLTAPMTLAALSRYANVRFRRHRVRPSRPTPLPSAAITISTGCRQRIAPRAGSSQTPRSKASAAFRRSRSPSTATTVTTSPAVSSPRRGPTGIPPTFCSFRSTKPTPRRRRGPCSIARRVTSFSPERPPSSARSPKRCGSQDTPAISAQRRIL